MTTSVEHASSGTTVPAQPVKPAELEAVELPIITDLFLPQGKGLRSEPVERSALHLASKSSRADVSFGNPLVENGVIAQYRRLFQPADAEGRRRRTPHPGDVLYWLTCLGAACLLLLAAT